MTGKLKPTLELRHQLNCGGIAIDAAAYDSRRHHLLTYGSHTLKPHTLRLFSLRREIRSTPLFDLDNKPPSPPPPAKGSKSPPKSGAVDPIASTTLSFVSLVYAHELDVFICVFSAFHSVGGRTKRPERTGYSVLFLEPASLKKLVVYTGPQIHSLRCACFDQATGRLVLASAVSTRGNNSRGSSRAVRVATPTVDEERSNVIEILEVSKRAFRRPASALSVASSAEPVGGLDRVILCVEKATRATMWHSDPIECIAGAHQVKALFGSGICVFDDDIDCAAPLECVVLEWRDQGEGRLALARRIVYKGTVITSLASPPSGKWLVVGCQSGLLAVWNMSRKSNSEDDNPQSVVPSDNESRMHRSAIESIELQPFHDDRTEAFMLYSTERANGDIKHWRFCVSASEEDPISISPCLDFFWSLGLDPSTQTDMRRKKRCGVGEWTRTIPLRVCVQMNNYCENLLIVTRSDMIHVIKIQPLVRVVHELSQGEDLFTVQLYPHRDSVASAVSLSGSSSYHRLGISALGSSTLDQSRDFILTPPSPIDPKSNVRVTRLKVCAIDFSEPWILCGWSTGVVEAFEGDRSTFRRAVLLQDPRFNSEVTAMSLVTMGNTMSTKLASTHPLGSAVICDDSSGGLLKLKSLSTRTHVLVFAGAATGAIVGWRVSLNGVHTKNGQYVLEAYIRLDTPPPHSSHVVNLFSWTKEATSIVSVAADGMIKLWSIPSMQLVDHINTASARGSGTHLGLLCSCAEAIGDSNVVVVGYEDGTFSAWRLHVASGRHIEIPVTGRHDRRVSSITAVDNSRFISASFDMTVVLWVITDHVAETRFFDLGGPIVDSMFFMGVVYVAMRSEICQFTLIESEVSRVAAGEFSEEKLLTSFDGEDSTSIDSISPILSQEESQPGPSSLPLPVSPPLASHSDESLFSIPDVVVPASLADSFGQPPRSGYGDSMSGPLEGWLTDQANESPIDTEVIAVYVRQFVSSCGTSGTIAAESLSQLLTMHHLPLSKHFRADFAVRKYLHDCKLDPKTRLTVADATNVLVEMQRSAGMDQDTLGGHSKRKSKTGRFRSDALERLAMPRRKRELLKEQKDAVKLVPVVTYSILGEKTVKWQPFPLPSSNQEVEAEPASSTGIVDEVGNVEPKGRRRRRVKDERISAAPIVQDSVRLPDQDLLNPLHLSASFQPMWTNGFCWCSGPNILIEWDQGIDDQRQNDNGKCIRCRQRLHSITVQSNCFRPHFTSRMIMRIISDVYTTMMEPAHHLLYKNEEEYRKGEELTIHSALWNHFQHKFGVQYIVEMKLKQFFVSVSHFVREIDAVAVFGELLALFQRVDVDEQVPHKMVALCVTAFGWFHAREMIVCGDPIMGSADVTAGGSSSDSTKATTWQFVSLSNALFCAQELLVYPLVSPGYLQNILMYMEDYSQDSPTRPHQDRSLQPGEGGPRWIELHRFLRLLVGEWKQQTTEFRVVERTLFKEPLVAFQPLPADEEALASVLEKLRLVLSCFVFYDHERVGLAEVTDFESILRRLKYLWPNEHLSEQEAAGSKRYQDSLTFENTIIAARKRFSDTNGDGRICYLDFWAMLYIVGIRTKSLLKFREIPSFCKDYKLEVSPELQEMLKVYMHRSSALLLPRGFHTTKSARDESVHHQHKRRVGGLYEGVFVVDKPAMMRTLSMNELLSDNPASANDGLYVDGSVPSLRQSASTNALDSYNSSIHASTRKPGVLRQRQPVVIGVRPSGTRPKPVAVISQALLPGAECGLGGVTPRDPPPLAVHHFDTRNPQQYQTPADLDSQKSYGSIYVQFPDTTPRRGRIEVKQLSPSDRKWTIESSSVNDEAIAWGQRLIEEHEEEQRERLSLHEERKHRATFAREQAAHAAAAAAAASATAAAHRRHYSQISPPAPSRNNASRSPKQALPSTSLAKFEMHDSEKHFELAQPQITVSSLTRSEDPAFIIPSVEKHAEIGQKQAVSTVDAFTHRVPRDENKGISVDFVSPEERVSQNVAEVDSPVESKWNSRHESGAQILQPVLVIATSSVESFRPSNVARDEISPPAEVIINAAAQHRDADATKPQLDALTSEVKKSHLSGGMASGAGDKEENGVRDATFSDAVPKAHEAPSLVKETHHVTEADEKKEKDTKIVPEHVARSQEDPIHIEELCIAGPRSASDIALVTKIWCQLAPEVEPTPSTSPSNLVLYEQSSISTNPSLDDIRPAKTKPVESLGTSNHVDIVPTVPTVEDSVIEQLNSPIAKTTNSPINPQEAKALLANPAAKPSTAELRHRFKFSQQPTFKLSAAIISNPFRSSQWKPRDNSDSDEDDCDGSGDFQDDDDADDDNLAVEDMKLRLSRGFIAALNKRFGRKKSTTKTAGLAALAFAPRRQGGSICLSLGGLNEVDPGRRVGKNIVRLDEDAERALYGDREKQYLGDGIGFSAEAEEYMKRKWTEFFGNAELSMFSPLKDALKDHEEAQRQQDELQSQLMRKRFDQQQLDTLKLRHKSSITTSQLGKKKADSNITFRERRVTREACSQIQQEVKLGEIASGDILNEHDTQYFHFKYSPDPTGYSILTVKLHATRGEADLFLSTETLAPCSSDFMWRSAEKYAVPGTSSASIQEGHKIVLFPHDLARAIDTNLTTTFYISVVALVPNTAFTLGAMTSGQKSEPSRAIQTVDNLIAHFNQLAKTYEGQASRRINMTRGSLASSSNSGRPGSGGMSSVDRLRAFLASAASSMESVGEESDYSNTKEWEGQRRSAGLTRRQSNIGDTSDEGCDSAQVGQRESLTKKRENEGTEDKRDDDGCRGNLENETLFQKLLESIGKKHSHSLHNAHSFVLGGPTAEQRELLEDEEVSLLETRKRFSPSKLRVSDISSTSIVGDEIAADVGEKDAIAVVTERRLSTSSSLNLQQRLGTKLKQRLSPLKSSAIASKRRLDTASLRVARYEPKLVAYSLSSLPPTKHQTSTPTVLGHAKKI